MKNTRFFTATTFVVYKNATLFHNHPKIRLWLPPGGHIEPNETPEEAAAREVKEETGLDVTLYRAQPPLFHLKTVQHLIPPVHVLLEQVGPDRQHIDFIFYATAHQSELHSETGEKKNDYRWFTKQKLDELPLQEDVRVLALEALSLLAT